MPRLHRLAILMTVPILFAAFLTACQTGEPKSTPPEKGKKIAAPVSPTTPTPAGGGALTGRVIALDPGHGGPWSGAVARTNGLRECDLNLSVALRLREMLKAAGATVVLTRESDTVLDGSSLAADLAARPALAQKADAEIFVSIHHNSDGGAGTRNDLEVYYRMSDDGPSMDLAQCLTWRLARELRQDAQAKSLFPGNYKVLRESPLPSVLLESFYLTDAKSAQFMATPAGVESEARAIAAGLTDYFALLPPRVTSATIDEIAGIHTVALSLAPGPSVDSASTQAWIDRDRRPGHAVSGEGYLTWTFAAPLPNGEHVLRVQGRNANGAAFLYRQQITVDRPAVNIAAQHGPASVGKDNEVLVTATVTDAFGMPVADDTTVACDGASAPSKTVDGAARFYLKPGSARKSLAIRCGKAMAQLPMVSGSGFRTLRVQNAIGNAPIGGAVVASGNRVLAVCTPEGWAAVPSDTAEYTVFADGYEPLAPKTTGGHTILTLQPIEGGALLGKRIVLDAAYGGRTPGAVGPSGLRASDVNMDVVRRTAALLRKAGAVVILPRDGDEELTELQRVTLAEEQNPELYICVSFGPYRDECHEDRSVPVSARFSYAGHYHKSANGIRLAEAIARELGGIPVDISGALVVQQTSCPSCFLQPAIIENATAEEKYRMPEQREAAATGIYRGIVNYMRTQPTE